MRRQILSNLLNRLLTMYYELLLSSLLSWNRLGHDLIFNWQLLSGLRIVLLTKVVLSLIIHCTLIVKSLSSFLSLLSHGSLLILSLQQIGQHLNEVHNFWSVEIVNANSARLLLLRVVLPVNLISNLLLLKHPSFFHLIEVNIKLLSIEVEAIQLIFSHSCSFRVLEASKCVEAFPLFGKDFEALNNSELLE